MTDTATVWQGTFGVDYTARNVVDYRQRVPFWKHVLEMTEAKSILDVGTNVGNNLIALRSIDPKLEMSGVDVNMEAVDQAAALGLDVVPARADEIVGIFGAGSADLVVTSGVLIHIAPHDLKATMDAIVQCSKRWVLCIEYEAEQETEIEYRGLPAMLWKRPFGKLYEAMGMALMEYDPETEGFPGCAHWILDKGEPL